MDSEDRMIRIENRKGLTHFELTGNIIKCCLEVMSELGSGFLESVYKNALFIAMNEMGMNVAAEKPFDVLFRNQKIGHYIVDLIVENSVVLEIKCCGNLLKEHQAQLINYLKITAIPIGLLVNFGNQKLEYKRLHHPDKKISLPF